MGQIRIGSLRANAGLPIRAKPALVISAVAVILAVAVAAFVAPGAFAAGGGHVKQLGSRTADLLRSILGPLVIVLVAVGGVQAYLKREIGVAVTLAAIALFLGLFIFAPGSAQHMIQDFWKTVTS